MNFIGSLELEIIIKHVLQTCLHSEYDLKILFLFLTDTISVSVVRASFTDASAVGCNFLRALSIEA